MRVRKAGVEVGYEYLFRVRGAALALAALAATNE